jgi:hypothetical protein
MKRAHTPRRPSQKASRFGLVLLTAASSALLLSIACGDHIEGSGETITEQRDVPAFTRLDVSGALNASVTIGSPQSVSVTGDRNVVPIIRTEVRGSTLVVEPEKRYTSRTSARVTITVANLTDIEVSGASTIEVSGIQASGMRLDASGASTVRASGRADTLDAEASGASRLRLSDLAVRDAEVDASGASTIELQVSGTLSGEASGASSVRYTGTPDVRVRTSGASSVHSR